MRAVAILTIAACLVFLFMPMAMIVAFAFFEDSYLTFPPRTWTVKWFAWALGRDEFLASLKISLLVGLSATVISTILAIPAAMAISRSRLAGAGILQGIFISPILIPTIILGISLLIYLNTIGFPLGFNSIVLGHVVLTTPFIIRNVLVSLAGMPPHIEEAASGLGSTPLRTFRRITLPLILPGIGAGAVLAFLISFDELAMTIFITSPNVITLPIRIFNYVEWHLDPGVAALSTILIAFTTLLLLVLARIRGPSGVS